MRGRIVAWSSRLLGVECARELAPRVVQPCPDGSHRYPQRPRDFFAGHSFDLRQKQNRPLRFGQRGKCALDAYELVACANDFHWIAPDVLKLEGEIEKGSSEPREGATLPPYQLGGNTEQPRTA